MTSIPRSANLPTFIEQRLMIFAGGFIDSLFLFSGHWGGIKSDFEYAAPLSHFLEVIN